MRLTPDMTPVPHERRAWVVNNRFDPLRMVMMSKSTANGRSCKPPKPYSDFPLFPHATRRWAKKIRGKLHYFGPWDDPDGALQKYLDQKDDLHAGRTPRVSGEGLTVRDLCNRFLTVKRGLVDSGEIVQRTFLDYHATCKRLVEGFGKSRLVSDLAADDFHRLRVSMAGSCGPVRLGNEVQRVRSVFKWAFDVGLVDKPVRFGPEFKRPPKRVIRKLRNAKGARMFEAHEIQRIMGHARDDMASAYRERISDERLKAVTDYVRRWLFGSDEGEQDIGDEVSGRNNLASK